MPRNQSEKLPSNPKAWEYAEAVDAHLKAVAADASFTCVKDAEQRVVDAWRRLDKPTRRLTNRYIRTATGEGLFNRVITERRKLRVAFIRGHYGP